MHRDDSDSEIVREEQDGVHRKLDGPTTIFHCYLLGGWLAICATENTWIAIQEHLEFGGVEGSEYYSFLEYVVRLSSCSL